MCRPPTSQTRDLAWRCDGSCAERGRNRKARSPWGRSSNCRDVCGRDATCWRAAPPPGGGAPETEIVASLRKLAQGG